MALSEHGFRPSSPDAHLLRRAGSRIRGGLHAWDGDGFDPRSRGVQKRGSGAGPYRWPDRTGPHHGPRVRNGVLAASLRAKLFSDHLVGPIGQDADRGPRESEAPRSHGPMRLSAGRLLRTRIRAKYL